MSGNRSWMYNPYQSNGEFSKEYVKGVKRFIRRAVEYRDRNGHVGIRCPCTRCLCVHFENENLVSDHIFLYGFMNNYSVWVCHGEQPVPRMDIVEDRNVHDDMSLENNECVNMVNDAFGVYGSGFLGETSNQVGGSYKEAPNPVVAAYYSMLEDANAPLFDGCEEFTKLSMTTQLVTRKVESKISQVEFERWVDMLKRLCPDKGVNIPSNVYEAKKMLAPMLLPKQKIHCCVKGCMLFYGEFSELEVCTFCDAARYEVSILTVVIYFVIWSNI